MRGKLNLNVNEITSLMKDKGFYEIKSKKSLNTKDLDSKRFGHKKLDGLILTDQYIPELIFYYNQDKTKDYIFKLAISILGTSREHCITFGKPFISVIKDKSYKEIINSLKLLFDQYVEFIDYIQTLRKISLSEGIRIELINLFSETRIKNIKSNKSKKDLLSEIKEDVIFPAVPSLEEPESLFGLYVRFSLGAIDANFSASKKISSIRDKFAFQENAIDNLTNILNKYYKSELPTSHYLKSIVLYASLKDKSYYNNKVEEYFKKFEVKNWNKTYKSIKQLVDAQFQEKDKVKLRDIEKQVELIGIDIKELLKE